MSFPKWVDIVQDQCYDDVNPVTLMTSNGILKININGVYMQKYLNNRNISKCVLPMSKRWVLCVFSDLVFMARSLAVLRQTFQRLVYQRDVMLVDVQA